MDTFMDKLAQKLNAQEIIKANTAAETEEMNQLKDRIKEYHEILDQIQQFTAKSAEKLENARVDGDEINRLVEESIAKIERMQQNNESVEELRNAAEELQNALAEQKNLVEELKTALSEKLENTNENIHKECVKVYRNVQAVVVEENNKQTESLTKSVEGMKDKLGPVLGISIAALAVSLGGVVFQVLVYLHIL